MKNFLPLVFACVLLYPEAAPAQELGKLFFTPEQRAALDARRKARVPDRPSAPVVASPTTRLDGYVSRSSGRSTVWVNGEPVVEGTSADGTRVYTRPGDPAGAAVSIGDGSRRVPLKVGQSVDRGSGEVRDPLGDGEIRIQRSGAR